MFLPSIDSEYKFFISYYMKFRYTKDNQSTGPFADIKEVCDRLCEREVAENYDLKLICLDKDTFASVLNGQLFTFSS